MGSTVQPASGAGVGIGPAGWAAEQMTGVWPPPHRLWQPSGEHDVEEGEAEHPDAGPSGRACQTGEAPAAEVGPGPALPSQPVAQSPNIMMDTTMRMIALPAAVRPRLARVARVEPSARGPQSATKRRPDIGGASVSRVPSGKTVVRPFTR